MTTLREAAQQALEALEFFKDTAICSADTEAASEAITALRAALVEPVAWTDADADAARLAMELGALLFDTKDTAALSRWWESAHDALELHQERLRVIEQAYGIGKQQ